MKYRFVTALLCLSLLSSCGGSLSGPGPLPQNRPVLNLELVPSGGAASDAGEFRASWTGGFAPYNIVWNFGGGASPASVGPLIATSPDFQTVLLSDNAGGSFTVTVSVTDALGQTETATSSYSYSRRSD